MEDRFEVHIYPDVAVPVLLPRAGFIGRRGTRPLRVSRSATLRVGEYRVLNYDTHNSNTPGSFDRLIKIVGAVDWRNPPYQLGETFYALEFTNYSSTRTNFVVTRRTTKQLKIWYVHRIIQIFEATVDER